LIRDVTTYRQVTKQQIYVLNNTVERDSKLATGYKHCLCLVYEHDVQKDVLCLIRWIKIKNSGHLG